MTDSLQPEYFDDVYARNRDPWQFETSEYERAKYADTLAALGRARYGSALEIGCSIGVLTAQLAARCDSLLSVDVSEAALAQARERCGALGHVKFERMQLPDEMPDGSFDLIVLSEVGYYWSRGDLQRTAEELAERQPAGGHLLLVHWTPFVPDYPLTGDQVHELWRAQPAWKLLREERRERYRLDVLERNT